MEGETKLDIAMIETHNKKLFENKPLFGAMWL